MARPASLEKKKHFNLVLDKESETNLEYMSSILDVSAAEVVRQALKAFRTTHDAQ